MAKRTAKLTIEGPTSERGGRQWVRLTARNGEPQMASELVSNAKRARAACVRSFQDVLESEGFVVLTPEELGVIIDKAKTFGRYESHRENAKAAMGVRTDAADFGGHNRDDLDEESPDD